MKIDNSKGVRIDSGRGVCKNNDNGNIMISSLAGTGKSTIIIKDILRRIENGEKVLYLAFNRKLREHVWFNLNDEIKKELKKITIDQRQINTHHQFAFRDVIYTNADRFDNFQKDSDLLCDLLEQTTDENRKIELNNILAVQNNPDLLINWWSMESEMTKYDDITHIYVDECQDMNGPIFSMVEKVYEINMKNNVNVTFGGDDYQSIYCFQNGGKYIDNFKKIKKHFGYFNEISLPICHRLTPSLQKFTNGFYELHYENPRYYDISRYNPNEFKEDVFIHTIPHKKNVGKYLSEIISQYSDKKIAILGRTNKEVDQLEKDFSQNGNHIRYGTIHSYKGCESDVAIVINTMYNNRFEKMEEKNVWNVANTRPKQKLHIITSFPEHKILPHFKDGTYTLVSDQHKRSLKNRIILPEQNKHLTKANAERSIIDSIEIRMNDDELPFIPREKQNLKKRSQFITDTKMNCDGMNYVLRQYQGKILYDFNDLNKPKREGFDDKKIIQLLIQIQKNYTANVVSEKVLIENNIRRLDLAKYFEVSSESIINTLQYFFKLANHSNDSAEKVVLYENNTNQTKTLYLNSHTVKKTRFRVIRAYFPKYKEQNEIIDGDNLLKVEIMRVRKNNDLFDKFNPPNAVKDLIKVIDKNELSDLYYKWLYDEFPYLKEKPVKNPSLHMKRYKITSLNDIKNHIDNGKIGSKDKRIYFYMLLNLISKEEQKDIQNIFNVKFQKTGI